MEKLSKEYIIQKVEGHKDLIRDATDRLSDTLYKFRKEHPNEFELNEEYSNEIRKILHEIISQVSMIGGFCDDQTRDYINKMVNIVGSITEQRISKLNSILLEFWAMKINAITPDYNKTPFRLSDMKPLASILENAFKSLGRQRT